MRSALFFILYSFPLLALEYRGDIGIEAVSYLNESIGYDSNNEAVSVRGQMEFFWSRENGDEFIVEPFFRLDSEDEERSHIDLRQLTWGRATGDFEFKLGLSQVYWGQTEFLHLVNIINQTDQVENPDGEDKLGQPMAELKWVHDQGSVEFYLMPYFRERTFPGRDGRLRSPILVDTDQAIYEHSSKENHPDFAIRSNHLLGDYELSFALFRGTDREPALNFNGTSLVPFYAQTTRLSFEGLKVWEDWIFKLEALEQRRLGEWEEAITGGFEWTKVGIFGTQHDLGFLLEGAWHSGGDEWSTFSSEAMGGMRWVWNDEPGTEVLAGAIVDVKHGSTLFSLEASRRLSDRLKINLEGRIFLNTDDDDPIHLLRNEDHIRLETQFYF